MLQGLLCSSLVYKKKKYLHIRLWSHQLFDMYQRSESLKKYKEAKKMWEKEVCEMYETVSDSDQ